MAAIATPLKIDGASAQNTKEWAREKIKMAAAASAAKLDFILTLGNAVHKLKQTSKERSTTEWQAELETTCHASMLMWSVKAQAVKSVISEKDSSFSELKPEQQGQYKDYVFDQFLRSANLAFVDAITEFLLPDGNNQNGPMVEALRAVISTPAHTKLRQGDFSDWLTSWRSNNLAADQPDVHLWVHVLEFFEGVGQSGVNSFYSQLTAAVAC